jgi:serine/threonine-protein phosphatase 5
MSCPAYGFEREVCTKYNLHTYQLFNEVFQWLPPAAIIESKVFVAHGGIPTNETVMLADIQAIKRGTEPQEPCLLFDLLWNDPMETPGIKPSGRGGTAKRFGPDITAGFLKRNNLDLMVRSHEVRMEGYSVEQDEKTITIFSAANYVGRVGNKGAFIHFDKTMKPVFTQFDAVPLPDS